MKAKNLFKIITFAMALSAQVQAQSFLTNGLTAYFPFSGNANDASGNGNNGTLFGAATFGVDRFGNSNSCISLPGTQGTGSGVDVPSLSSMPYVPLTYSVWFLLKNYPPYQSDGSVMELVGREQCGNDFDAGLCVYSQTSPSYVDVFRYYTGTLGSISQLVPPTNQWCQLVLTVDAATNTTFYFNGTSVPSEGPSPAGQPLDFRIGASASGGCNTDQRYVWNGLIDDVRIYNRVLSSNEVQQLYNYESTTSEPCIPHPAIATATMTDGFVVQATVTDGGCGYTNVPLVAIVGGGGTGATAVAQVNNGVVTNIMITDAGNGYASTPTIVIGGPPSITAQPQSVTVNANSPAVFSVTAVGTASMNYQWSFNGTNIPGATSSTLSITNVVQTNLGTYAVVVSNPFDTTNSSNAVLSMYPYLVTPFGGLDTTWGYTNILSVDAWGSGPLSYQWYQNGVALSGDTNSTLDFTGIQFMNGGLYTVVVSNPFGSTTNTPEEVVVNPAGVSFGFSPTLTISGVTGYTYLIQRTANLADTNAWVSVTNLTLTQPVQIWADTSVDASSPFNTNYFYQVLPGQQ